MGGEDERCCLSRADVITWSRLHSQHVSMVRSLIKQRENITFLDADSSNSDQPSNLECRSCETEFYINSSVVSETKLGHKHRYLPNTICVRGAHLFFFLAREPQQLVWAKICALLGNYATCSCNFYRRCGTTYRSRLQGSRNQKKIFLTPEDGTDKLSRNVCKELPLYSA